MTNVAEHDGEQEWKSDNGEKSWVNLLIRCDTIAVHDSLEALSELVGTMECGRCLLCL